MEGRAPPADEHDLDLIPWPLGHWPQKAMARDMGVAYCTREDVKSALDVKETARNDAQVDRAIEAASRSIEGALHRRFYPEVDTRYFDWPNYQRAAPWRLWLDANELISVTTLAAGGIAIAASDYFLRRSDDLDEPPYTFIDLDLASSAAFGGGATHQRDIAVTGVFGYSADETPAGALAEALDASETEVDVTDSALIGVGSIIRADSERMTVTGKAMLDTGQNLQTPLTAQANDVTVAVSDGTAFHIAETVLLDAERMLIVDVAGNNLIVKRAWDGSVLAAHTASDIYAPRRLTVERGALGTTAATHLTAALVTKHYVPGTIRSLCIAEAINTIQQEQSAYGRVVGSGENQREASGQGLKDLRNEAYTRYGRKARVRAI